MMNDHKISLSNFIHPSFYTFYLYSLLSLLSLFLVLSFSLSVYFHVGYKELFFSIFILSEFFFSSSQSYFFPVICYCFSFNFSLLSFSHFSYSKSVSTLIEKCFTSSLVNSFLHFLSFLFSFYFLFGLFLQDFATFHFLSISISLFVFFLFRWFNKFSNLSISRRWQIFFFHSTGAVRYYFFFLKNFISTLIWQSIDSKDKLMINILNWKTKRETHRNTETEKQTNRQIETDRQIQVERKL